jgi:hypothetical protein
MEDQLVQQLSKSENPSIRYLIKRDYLGMPENSSEVTADRGAIRTSPFVEKLLQMRREDGKFPWHAYAKWKGAFWTLLTLVDMGYPPGDLRLLPLKDQVLEWLLDSERLKRIPLIDGRYRRCALQESAAVLIMLRLGLLDNRIEQLVELLLKWQWPDGGWNCDKKSRASHSSFFESLIPLRGLHAYALATGDGHVKTSVNRVAELFLSKRLFKRLTNGQVIYEGFTQLHFPFYWHYNILIGLIGMQESGHLSDPRCGDALDVLESKRLPGGGFAAEKKYYRFTDKEGSGVTQVNWGPTGTTRMNEWVTVKALSILKQAGRI